jgi:hypothetical protein
MQRCTHPVFVTRVEAAIYAVAEHMTCVLPASLLGLSDMAKATICDWLPPLERAADIGGQT